MKHIRLSMIVAVAALTFLHTSHTRAEEWVQPLTPMDQSQNPEDLRITREIRKSLVGDDTLSINAKNVKVITVQGVVTIRGPVKNQSEKNAVEMYVRQIAADRTVNNLLEVEQTTLGK